MRARFFPTACRGSFQRFWNFPKLFTAKKAFQFQLSPLGNPKYCPKRKSCRIGNALRGSPLLQGFPSFPHSPPDCGENSPFSERTACKRFGSCEKVWVSNQGANEGLCPFNPHAPFKKGSILNFYDFLFREGFHSRGSFGGFQAPQRALENTGRSDR